MSSFDVDSCDLLQLTKDALLTNEFSSSSSSSTTPTQQCVIVCLAVVVVTFLTSTASGNYSQVDKIWSIVPFVYTWLVVCDARTLLMAVVSTIWGIRLTWNFNRRGGYQWPPWEGDEDYRWKYIQDGFFVQILQNKFVWAIFNFGFISLYQNVQLLLIATPSVIAHLVATSCGESPLNVYDYVAASLFLAFVVLESIADNQQYAFQTEKYRQRNQNNARTINSTTTSTSGGGKEVKDKKYASGFNQSGLFSIIRKPNYAAEQAIWICFYVFSIASVQGEQLVNWTIVGCILLCLLFQSSGWFTEKITLTKYPKYKEYMKITPLYVPNPLQLLTRKKKPL